MELDLRYSQQGLFIKLYLMDAVVMDARVAWADKRLREGKATGHAVLKWLNANGELIRYKCISGYNRWGRNVGRVLVSLLDHLAYRSNCRPRVLCVGSLVFRGTPAYDDACMEGLLSEYEIDCDGVLGTLLLPDTNHLFNLASCADRKCDANARLAYDRRFKSVSLKQIKTIRSGDQIKFWYGDEFGKLLKDRR